MNWLHRHTDPTHSHYSTYGTDDGMFWINFGTYERVEDTGQVNEKGWKITRKVPFTVTRWSYNWLGTIFSGESMEPTTLEEAKIFCEVQFIYRFRQFN